MVLSQLSRKFIDKNNATPAETQWVVYCSLVIGHHPGIVDYLEAALTYSQGEYLAQVATLVEGSEARRKIEGVPKYGEIVVDFSHAQMLTHAFDDVRAMQTPQQQEWGKLAFSMLHDIHQESVIYLMVRRYRD